MQVEIEVALAAQRAIQQSELLWQNLERARVTAWQISVAAANIRLPTVTGGGTAGGSGGNVAQNTNAMNALAAAIARQRATAQTAQAATMALNNAIAASVGASNAASQAITALAAAQARQAAQAQQAGTNNQTQTATTAGLVSGVLRLAASYITLRAAWSFTGESIAQGIAIENLTNTLTATSGSAVKAASDLAFLRSESQRIGISFIESAQGFVKFDVAVQGAGLSSQLARDTFTALSEASRRLGLSGSQQASVFLALEQMISKSVVSMQELRVQLGNALPGAFQIATRAMQMTGKEFNNLVSTGNLLSTEFVPKFVAQLNKELPLTAEAAASTAAEISRLGNAWQDFQAKLAGNVNVKGAADFLSGVVEIGAALVDNRTAAEQKAARNPSSVRRGQIGRALTEGDTSFLSGASDEDINRWMGLENRLASQQAAKAKKAAADALATSSGDTATESEIERANKFWKTYRTLASDALTEEENKRQDVINKYADAIQKIRTNADQFSKPMVDALVSEARKAQANQLTQFDDKAALDRAKQIADETKRIREDAEKLKDIQIKLIPDVEAQKIAQINLEFDEIRDKLLLFELGNPSSISGNWEKEVETARKAAIEVSRQKFDAKKTPLSGNFGALMEERNSLRAQLPNEITVQEFEETARRIADINHALNEQLRSGNVGLAESFKFGFQEVQESWGSTAERMATVGAELADSLQRNISGALSDIALGTKEPKEAFADMSRAIVAELIKVAIQQLIVKQLLSGLSSFGGGGATYSAVPAGHAGMVVGLEGMTTQFAPRFHSGTGPIGDEKMVMARQGEVIFTPEQMKAMNGKQSGQPITMINLFDRKVFEQMRAANPDAVVNEIGQNKTLIRQMLQ